jgi:hypothetical protein
MKFGTGVNWREIHSVPFEDGVAGFLFSVKVEFIGMAGAAAVAYPDAQSMRSAIVASQELLDLFDCALGEL